MTTPSVRPTAYTGLKEVDPPNQTRATRDPTANDYKTFDLGDEWLNTTTNTWWKLADKAAAVATWIRIGGEPGEVAILEGNTGQAEPDAAHTIFVLGDEDTGISTTGDNVNTLTISDLTLTNGQIKIGATGAAAAAGEITSIDGSITVTLGANTIDLSTTGGDEDIEQIDGNTGSAVPVAGVVDIIGDTTTGISTAGSGNTLTLTNAIASNAETITGAITNKLVVPAGLNAKLGTQTANAMPYGAGSTAALAWGAAMTNGQLMIGATAAAPAAANILSADGSVTITNSANGIDLSSGGGLNYIAYNANVNNTTTAIATWTLADWDYVYVRVISFAHGVPGAGDERDGVTLIDLIALYTPQLGHMLSPVYNQWGATSSNNDIYAYMDVPQDGTRVVTLYANSTNTYNSDFRLYVWSVEYNLA